MSVRSFDTNCVINVVRDNMTAIIAADRQIRTVDVAVGGHSRRFASRPVTPSSNSDISRTALSDADVPRSDLRIGIRGSCNRNKKHLPIQLFVLYIVLDQRRCLQR